MKVIVYGLGKNFYKYQNEIKNDYEVLNYSDIDSEKVAAFEGIHPEQICDYDYDFILVTADARKEITNFLIAKVGIEPSKIKFYEYERDNAILSSSKLIIGPSYSENAEDYIIDRLIEKLGISYKEMHYLELGANEPILASNTYYFYQRGARGILVEANPNAINLLKLIRPEDEIIEKAVYKEDNTEISFYLSEEPGLSSVIENHTELSPEWSNFKKSIVTVQTITVNTLMQKIENCDLLSIDLEGYDLEVLMQLDMHKYKPKIIVIEMLNEIPFRLTNEKIKRLLEAENYLLYARTRSNGIWIDAGLWSKK